jgi:hypothetical protein
LIGRVDLADAAERVVLDLLGDDPTQNLAALGTIEAVIADGRLYPIDTLRLALQELRRYFDRPVVELSFGTAARAGFAIAERSFARARAERPE